MVDLADAGSFAAGQARRTVSRHGGPAGKGAKSGLEAVILAGGLGTRLRSVAPDLPKVLAPVGGRPFLHHLLHNLARNGFGRIVLSIGYRAGMVMRAVGDTFAGLEISYAREEQPLGTGGGLRLAMAQCHCDHVFVMNGDTFLDADFAAAEDLWRGHGEALVIGCAVPDTRRYGRLAISNDHVTSFQEKGLSGPGIINAGCYVLPSGALESFAPGQAFSLETEFLRPAAARGQLRAAVSNGLFIDIGVPEDYQAAQPLFAGGLPRRLPRQGQAGTPRRNK